ncbi:MAG: hypothetical protein ABSH53_24130 [Holophaga sp.]|jgi:hypothetical protein
MLNILETRKHNCPVIVEIDEYLPLAVKAYARPFDPTYYRLGNFKTSLAEIPINPNDGLVMGIDLICFDKICKPPELVPEVKQSGLPIAAMDKLEKKINDELMDVRVSLFDHTFFLDWRDPSYSQAGAYLTEQGRLHYLIQAGKLQGALISALSDREVGRLEEHMARISGYRS